MVRIPLMLNTDSADCERDSDEGERSSERSDGLSINGVPWLHSGQSGAAAGIAGAGLVHGEREGADAVPAVVRRASTEAPGALETLHRELADRNQSAVGMGLILVAA